MLAGVLSRSHPHGSPSGTVHPQPTPVLAGVLSRTRRLTKDGFELHFGVNFLGQYAFTSLMLPQLLAANK